MVNRYLVIMPLLCAAMLSGLAACNKTESARPADSKAANDKAVRDNAVWGEQVKALDKAKEVQKTVEKDAAEAAKKIDDATK